MKIRITMEIADDYADPSHEMGVTEKGYEEIVDALMSYGEDVEIRKVSG
jgi:hypothetical protein